MKAVGRARLTRVAALITAMDPDWCMLGGGKLHCSLGSFEFRWGIGTFFDYLSRGVGAKGLGRSIFTIATSDFLRWPIKKKTLDWGYF
jgi:hypothetical protein